jgi:acyl dehydratase
MSRGGTEPGDDRFDLSDVDHRVGKAVGGAQFWEPCSAQDIRRWVMAMDYPNPLHWDEEFARASKFGAIVAPQSFTTALDCGQGVQAALVGRIPGSLLLYGGDEWWFYGQRIQPGDQHVHERRFHGYKIMHTKFAGPTMFSSGDTVHRNRRSGALVARQRATVIRYLAHEAHKRSVARQGEQPKAPQWSEAQLQKIDEARHAWILSYRMGVSPHFDQVQLGEALPSRVIGPHSVISFTTQQRAFPFNIWGTSHPVGVAGLPDAWTDQDAGWAKGFELDHTRAKIDPRFLDGLHAGPSRGHLANAQGSGIAVSRAFGFGAAMGAWVSDYLAYWAGHEGFVRHTKVTYRGMAMEGDVAYVEAQVTGKEPNSLWGVPLISLKVRMKNQDGAVLLDGAAEVELPL